MANAAPIPQQQIALITGAARRIGSKIAISLAQAGFDIALHTSARSQPDAEILAKQLRSAGRRVYVIVADLADAAATAAIMPQIASAFGPTTALINNASVFEPDDAVNFSAASLDLHMAVNLRAPLILASAMAKALPGGMPGNIINIIDQRVWRLNPRFCSYTLSKSALWTATQTMAQAFAPRIRVNAIGPGPTLANTRQDAGEFQKQANAVLLRRAVEPDDIAEAVLFLLGAKSVTGQMIAIDNGQHLAWETPDVAGVVE